MTVYAILSKVEEPVPSGKIDFIYNGSGSGTAFTVPSGVTKVRITLHIAVSSGQGYDDHIGTKVFSVTAGQTIYANDKRWCSGAPGVTPIFFRPLKLEYGPEINKLPEGKQ